LLSVPAVAGFLFLCLLLVQWLNAGRELVFDPKAGEWLYSPPPVPWLPSAVRPEEAFQMLCWFVPAWALLLALGSGLLGPHACLNLLRAVAINSGLLALFGILQFASGTRAIYGLMPVPDHFFASFGYQSHAGAYFVLMLGLTTGLLCHQLFSRTMRRSPAWIAVLVGTALLDLAGAMLSLSLAPMLLGTGLAALATAYVFWQAWIRLRAAGRLNLAALTAGLVCLSAFLAITAARTHSGLVSLELAGHSPAHWGERLVNKRLFMMEAATRIWADHPWFGTGGWGFRYLLGLYLPRSEWYRIGDGTANVHNDPLQFLSEFGLVGAGLLAVVLGSLVVTLVRSKAWRRSIAVLPLAGLAAVLAYSLVDLPFRSPAVLYAWLLTLAALPRIVLPENPTQGRNL
jgi:O-antigen ligase